MITPSFKVVYCFSPHLFKIVTSPHWLAMGAPQHPSLRAPGPSDGPTMERPMLCKLRWIVPVIILSGVAPAAADVITDWNEKAVAFVTARAMLPPPAERTVASMHAAMFDAVNSIERSYRPYAVQLPAAKDASQDAAAA